MAKVHHIQQHIREVDPKKDYTVAIPVGAPEALVGQRQLRNKYQTNREIKYWSTFFLLKALTTSGHIQNWRSQRQFLLSWLQLNEPTFYTHLKALKQRQLLTVDQAFNIHLVSMRDAAKLLGLEFAGVTKLPYNPIKNAGKQVFQYLMMCEEIRSSKTVQTDGLVYNLEKNPPLRNHLLIVLQQRGADEQQLVSNKNYLQERLLNYQMQIFRHGSEILEYIFERRADVNRSIGKIKEHYAYKTSRSVRYLKKKLQKLGLVEIKKISVVSECRSRRYVPDATKKSGRRDGYKWLKQALQTEWTLCDQITVTYQPVKQYKNEKASKKAA